MRMLVRRRRMPQAKTIRPAERYLIAAREEARRLGHELIGTEHLLAALVRDPNGATARLLRTLRVSTENVRAELARWLDDPSAGKSTRRHWRLSGSTSTPWVSGSTRASGPGCSSARTRPASASDRS
jgi:ATP-dependent Clp protease ATP-binding subunit ClpA